MQNQLSALENKGFFRSSWDCVSLWGLESVQQPSNCHIHIRTELVPRLKSVDPTHFTTDKTHKNTCKWKKLSFWIYDSQMSQTILYIATTEMRKYFLANNTIYFITALLNTNKKWTIVGVVWQTQKWPLQPNDNLSWVVGAERVLWSSANNKFCQQKSLVHQE